MNTLQLNGVDKIAYSTETLTIEETGRDFEVLNVRFLKEGKEVFNIKVFEDGVEIIQEEAE